MKLNLARFASFWHLPRWFPEILIIRSGRIRNQVRLLALAGLVGIVAGVGAIVFYVATRAAEHYALGVVAGYSAEPRPGGEPAMAWLPPVNHPLHWWLLLVVPTVGGLHSGALVFTLAPEAEGHGTDSAIAAYHNHQGQIRPRVPLVKIDHCQCAGVPRFPPPICARFTGRQCRRHSIAHPL
jgi:CIC family chloride channel protein